MFQVSQDDELPKTLCNTCHELLEKFSNFKSACIQSQNTLVFQNNMKLPTDDNLIHNSDVNCEIDESCEVVVSELKVNDDADVESNDHEILNNDFDESNQDQNSYSNNPSGKINLFLILVTFAPYKSNSIYNCAVNF